MVFLLPASLLLLAVVVNGHVEDPANTETVGNERLQNAITGILARASLPNFTDEMSLYDEIIDSFFNPKLEVTFHLFTVFNPQKSQRIKVEDLPGTLRSFFDSAWPTKIIVHGWTDSVNTFWVRSIRRNYLTVGNYNVIAVDWSNGAAKDYLISEKLTKQVGNYIGEMLTYLQSKANLSLGDVHILGHSLGAHISGIAGFSVSGKIGRITGMDPARPGFEVPVSKDLKDRLDSSDAKFVDVIHTCSGTLGFIAPIGHLDFYPNGGTFRQPGCPSLISQYCSHGRSHQFMAESIIRPDAFLASRCNSWTEFTSGRCHVNADTIFMGEHVNHSGRGIFYLRTNDRAPFGLNK